MASIRRISALATKITEQTSLLDEYYTENSIPQPSFEKGSWIEPIYSDAVDSTRNSISDACRGVSLPAYYVNPSHKLITSQYQLDELVTGSRKMMQMQAWVIFRLSKCIQSQGKLTCRQAEARLLRRSPPI